MSQMECHTGILHKVNLHNKNSKEWMVEKIKSINVTIDYDKVNSENWVDYLNDLFFKHDIYDKYYIDFKTETVYEIINHKSYYEDDELDIWETLPNGDIQFITQFYNGGCCFDEAVEWGIEKAKHNNVKNVSENNILTVDYEQITVPEYNVDEITEYYNMYLHGTKMHVGIKVLNKEDNTYSWALELEGYDDQDWYNNETEMLKHLNWIFNQDKFSWRYYD